MQVEGAILTAHKLAQIFPPAHQLNDALACVFMLIRCELRMLVVRGRFILQVSSQESCTAQSSTDAAVCVFVHRQWQSANQSDTRALRGERAVGECALLYCSAGGIPSAGCSKCANSMRLPSIHCSRPLADIVAIGACTLALQAPDPIYSHA